MIVNLKNYLNKNIFLFQALVRRDISQRYRSTMLGWLWVMLQPLLMLSIYVFIFGFIYKSKWGADGSIYTFIPMLFCGLIIYSLFSDTISRTLNIFISNPNYIKKIIFPIELLNLSVFFSNLINAFINIFYLYVYLYFFNYEISYNFLYIPLILLIVFFYSLGLSFFFSTVNVFIRDTEQLVSLSLQALLFLSPIFYSSLHAPQLFIEFLSYNPLTYPIETLRNIIVDNQSFVLLDYLHHLIISFFIFILGFIFFNKYRFVFSDVI